MLEQSKPVFSIGLSMALSLLLVLTFSSSLAADTEVHSTCDDCHLMGELRSPFGDLAHATALDTDSLSADLLGEYDFTNFYRIPKTYE